MKAKDYAKQFVESIYNQDFTQEAIIAATRVILNGLMAEYGQIMIARKCTKRSAIDAIIVDYNRKWNNIADEIEKETKTDYLQRNAFKKLATRFLNQAIAELNPQP